jgi:apolipoprotein D and lipocalin family protein
MPKRLLLAALTFLAVVGCANAPPVNRAEQPPLGTAAQVDLARYGGLWHEAARFPNQFERDCVAATATYTKRNDGLIGVTNVCTKVNGERATARGRAKVADTATNAKLKVSFFGPFFVGDYWVLDVARDYSWALVGEGSGRYLWILTREEKIDGALRADLISRLEALGYRTDALYWNPGLSPTRTAENAP